MGREREARNRLNKSAMKPWRQSGSDSCRRRRCPVCIGHKKWKALVRGGGGAHQSGLSLWLSTEGVIILSMMQVDSEEGGPFQTGLRHGKWDFPVSVQILGSLQPARRVHPGFLWVPKAARLFHCRMALLLLATPPPSKKKRRTAADGHLHYAVWEKAYRGPTGCSGPGRLRGFAARLRISSRPGSFSSEGLSLSLTSIRSLSATQPVRPPK